MLTRLLHSLVLHFILCVLVLLSSFGFAQPAWAAEAYLPTTALSGAPVPDFSQVTFAQLPALQEAGTIALPAEIAPNLGWNPTRSWSVGTPLSNVLQLGDLEQTFALQTFNLDTIAPLAGLDLNQVSLSNLKLLQNQTIATLVNTIPGLGNLPLNQVAPLFELVNGKLPTLGLGWKLDTLARQPLSAIANNDLLGGLSLNNLDLNQFSFTSIPSLNQVAIASFKGWEGTPISGIPGLDKVPFGSFPLNPFQLLGTIARHDMTYGGDRAHKESRQTPTKFSITGSDKVGFHYNCVQAKGCDYIELNAPGYSGLGALSDPGQLHGARWIRGGKGDGAQMVPGGRGILGKLNGGMEPTGQIVLRQSLQGRPDRHRRINWLWQIWAVLPRLHQEVIRQFGLHPLLHRPRPLALDSRKRTGVCRFGRRQRRHR